jgi:CheY-like chemotaxis protein
VTRVLIVENDALCRADIALTLVELGHEVVEAANGHVALELLSQSAESPNVILLDLSTPVMTGWEFRKAQLADARYRDVPIVIMSGHPGLDTPAHQLGAKCWLRKPFELDDLIAAVS